MRTTISIELTPEQYDQLQDLAVREWTAKGGRISISATASRFIKERLEEEGKKGTTPIKPLHYAQ